MADENFEEGQKEFDFGHYLDIARRRQLHFIIPLLAGWMLVWGVSWALSPRYKSSTLILVEEPTMSKTFVANMEDDLQQRLTSLQQQILSRTRLLTIIDNLGLYNTGTHKMSDDDKVTKMRKEINIETVRDTQTAGITAFRIDYSAHDPRVAQAVTGQLAQLFINDNQMTLLKQSGDTTKFLETQLETARQALADQEAKVKQFQATHVGALPSEVQSNLQILSGLQQQLSADEDAMNTAAQQQALLQTELEQYQTNRPQAQRATTPDPNGVEALDVQLAKLRDQLTDLQSRYTDNYPDVVKTKAEIAQTQRLRTQAAEKAAKNATPNGLTAEENATLAQLKGQVQSAELEIQNRRNGVAELKQRIAQYEGRINAEPASEQQLADLQRGYDQSQKNYDDLLKKKEESQLSTNMEQMQQGERFTQLDPPSLPTKPDFPDRLIFCVIGLALGIMMGGASVALFEFLDDRMYNPADIKELLPIPVVCEIPQIINPAEELKARKKNKLVWATTVTAVLIILVGSAVSFIHG